MVQGRCFTNLDDYDTSIVRVFDRVPNIGERVAVLYKGCESDLKIVQITHDVYKPDPEYSATKPYIIIELHN